MYHALDILSAAVEAIDRGSGSAASLVGETGLVVRLVLLLLVGMSAVSWAVIWTRWRLVRRTKRDSHIFMGLFDEKNNLERLREQSKDFPFAPPARIFVAGVSELARCRRHQISADELEKALDARLIKVKRDELDRLTRSIPFLASTGSTAPFIGLFGTVWGIMSSFQQIRTQQTVDIGVVGGGISEALIATAVGLFAAIPAVLAYNSFSNTIDRLSGQYDDFIEFLKVRLRHELTFGDG